MSSCRLRRRGEVLRDAVFAAALAEIADVGLRRVSMESIASRAGTGKAALYRRWPNVRALVIEALGNTMDEIDPPLPDSTGSLRADLLLIFGRIASALDSPSGRVVLELVSEASRDPDMMAELQARYGSRRQLEAVRLIEQAMLRGEIPRQDLDPFVLMAAPALLFHQLILTGTPASEEQVAHIVDHIVLPLLRQPSEALVSA
jgi:AcrR family transcriptional regulator